MTWVLSSPTLFGYSVMISDVRVSLQDKRYFDCLQKMHSVQDTVVVGFAGNVMIAFALVEELRDFLAPLPTGCGWDPDFVAAEWPARATDAWQVAQKGVDQACRRVSLQIAMVHPEKDDGIPGHALPCILTFRSPSFSAEYGTLGKCVSIGSGTTRYAARIDDLNTPESIGKWMNMEVGHQGGFGAQMAHLIQMEITDHPDPTVSPIIQTAMVWRDRAVFQYNLSEDKGSGWTFMELSDEPPVKLCTSWSELSKELRRKGISTRQAKHAIA